MYAHLCPLGGAGALEWQPSNLLNRKREVAPLRVPNVTTVYHGSRVCFRLPIAEEEEEEDDDVLRKGRNSQRLSQLRCLAPGEVANGRC